ncbi:MAG: hypothetical protein ACTSU5_17920 [Promethearchaeota archaeon]
MAFVVSFMPLRNFPESASAAGGLDDGRGEKRPPADRSGRSRRGAAI